MARNASERAARSGEGTVDKAIDVLFALHAQAGPRGVTSIGRELGIPKSSAHRLLTSLVRRGLVERDERGGYRLGMALVALGRGILEREPLVVAVRPVLEAAAAELGETCFLVCARNRALVVLDKVEGSGFLRASPEVGATVPGHATAAGKLYFAFAPEALALGPSETLERFTERTPSSEALAKEVERARRRRIAVNRDEWIDGLTVVAAPVFETRQSAEELTQVLVGAVALAVPSPRARELGIRALEARVGDAAEYATRRLARLLLRPYGEEAA